MKTYFPHTVIFLIGLALCFLLGCEQNPVNNNDNEPYIIPDSTYDCVRIVEHTWKTFGDSLVVKFSPVKPKDCKFIIIIVLYADHQIGVTVPVTQETGMIIMRYYAYPNVTEVRVYKQFHCRS